MRSQQFAVEGRWPSARDYDVDGSDFLVWQQDLGSTPKLNADGNNNSVIDAGDLEVWKANFSGVAIAAAAAVPEPATGALVVIASFWACRWRAPCKTVS